MHTVAGTASHVQRSAEEFAALPSDDWRRNHGQILLLFPADHLRQGLIDHQAVRYVLHRMFVQKYGCMAALVCQKPRAFWILESLLDHWQRRPDSSGTDPNSRHFPDELKRNAHDLRAYTSHTFKEFRGLLSWFTIGLTISPMLWE